MADSAAFNWRPRFRVPALASAHSGQVRRPYTLPSGLYREELRLYREELRLYREELRLYREELRLYREELRLDREELRLDREELEGLK